MKRMIDKALPRVRIEIQEIPEHKKGDTNPRRGRVFSITVYETTVDLVRNMVENAIKSEEAKERDAANAQQISKTVTSQEEK